MDIEGIFKNRIPNEKKIRVLECEKRGNTYFLSVDLSEPQLKMYIKISEKGKVSFKVIDIRQRRGIYTRKYCRFFWSLCRQNKARV